MWKGLEQIDIILLKHINKGTQKWRIFNFKPSDHDVGMFEQHPPPSPPTRNFFNKIR